MIGLENVKVYHNMKSVIAWTNDSQSAKHSDRRKKSPVPQPITYIATQGTSRYFILKK